MKTYKTRIWALLLATILLLSNSHYVSAEDAVPYSSAYLFDYTAYLNANGTTFQIWYNVTGMDTLPDLGAHTVIVQRSRNGSSWTNVKTYYYTDAGYEHMMGHQVQKYRTYVTYEGVSGYYYRALVKVWGGDGTNGDMRPVYTTAVLL